PEPVARTNAPHKMTNSRKANTNHAYRVKLVRLLKKDRMLVNYRAISVAAQRRRLGIRQSLGFRQVIPNRVLIILADEGAAGLAAGLRIIHQSHLMEMFHDARGARVAETQPALEERDGEI